MRSALAYASPPRGAASPVAARLDRARRAVEDRFLAAGDVLAQAVEGVSQLVASLEQLAKALDPATVSSATGDLHGAADSLLALPERHAARREAVASLGQAGAALAGGVEDMSRNLAYLRVFAINIKITAAGITAASKEFADFAQEICDCIEQGRDQLNAFEAELRSLRDVFRGALAHEHSLAEQCAALLPATPQSLVASAAAMEVHHRGIAQGADQVAALARAVQKKIGSALAGLQVGDITRQRIEHVSEILAMLDEVGELTGDQRQRLDGFVHGLLAGLLRAASDDFHREVERINAAMNGIAGDAREILRLRELAVGREQAGDEGFLRRLEGEIGRAMVLVDDMAAADRRALEMGGSAAAAAAGLGARIAGLRTIKTDVQQMALNTTLKCARIGDSGKPLAVIAVELRVNAGHMETSAQTALSALDTVSTLAERLSRGEASADSDETALASDIGAALSGVSRGLRQVSDTVEADLVSLASQGEAVVSALRRAADGLDLRDAIGVVLDDAAEAFEAQALRSPRGLADLAGPLGALLARAAGRYTMASEREVHERMTASLDFTADSPVATARAADLEDALF